MDVWVEVDNSVSATPYSVSTSSDPAQHISNEPTNSTVEDLTFVNPYTEKNQTLTPPDGNNTSIGTSIQSMTTNYDEYLGYYTVTTSESDTDYIINAKIDHFKLSDTAPANADTESYSVPDGTSTVTETGYGNLRPPETESFSNSGYSYRPSYWVEIGSVSLSVTGQTPQQTVDVDSETLKTPVQGTIDFTDTDVSAEVGATAQVTAEIIDGGNALTAAQQSLLDGAFHVGSVTESPSTGQGSLAWSYDPGSSLSFLDGKIVQVNAVVDVKDSDGNDDTATETFDLDDDSSLQVSAENKTVSASYSLGSDPFPPKGSITFIDADPSANVSATVARSASSPAVTVTDANGDPVTTLTASQSAMLADAFKLGAITESPTTGVGSVAWTYDPGAADLSFLAGDSAAITSTVDVADSDGNSDTATVTVTVNVPGSAGQLFTSGDDVVNFDSLSAAQSAFITSDPALIYNALGGSDTVTLPLVAGGTLAGTSTTFDPSQVFTLGDGNSDLTGGRYALNLAIGTGTYDVTLNNSNISCTWGGGSGDLVLSSTTTGPISVNLVANFQGSDSIDFSGLGDLTLSTMVPGGNGISFSDTVASLYSGSQLVATIHCGAHTDARDLLVLSDGDGGTKVELDPSESPEDPDVPGIDWSYIHKNESPGGVSILAPYVPNAKTASDNSGVTVAQGVDLGSQGSSQGAVKFANVFASASYAWNTDPNLSFLAGGVGLNHQQAITLVKAYGAKTTSAGDPYSSTVSLTTDQANALTYSAEQSISAQLVADYNAATEKAGQGGWDTLTDNQKTGMMDIAFNVGLQRAKPHYGLENFSAWTMLVNHQWAQAATRIMTYGIAAQRKLTDATYIADGQPFSAYTITGDAVSSGDSYHFTVADPSAVYQLDPTGPDLTLAESGGSPGIASILMPEDVAASYRVSDEQNGVWSAASAATPGETIAFLGAGVEGIRVQSFAADGQPVPSDTDFSFDVTFAGEGTFNGTATETGAGTPASSPAASATASSGSGGAHAAGGAAASNGASARSPGGDGVRTAPADTVSIGPFVTYADGVFTLAGRASSTAGVSSVEISAEVDGTRQDLGAATLGPNGTFTFQDKIGANVQGFFQATETDALGGQATSADPLFSLRGGLGPRYGAALQAIYNEQGSQTGAILFRPDGQRTSTVETPGQTVTSAYDDTFLNHNNQGTTFVFDLGHSQDVVRQFVVGGDGHDTLSFLGSDFGNSPTAQLGNLLRHTTDGQGGLTITDPTTQDTVTLKGATKAQLIQNERDIVFR